MKTVEDLRPVAALGYACFTSFVVYQDEVWKNITDTGGEKDSEELVAPFKKAYLNAAYDFERSLDNFESMDLDTRFVGAHEHYLLKNAIKSAKLFISEDPYDDSDTMQAVLRVTQRDFGLLTTCQQLQKAIQVIAYYADGDLYLSAHCEEYADVDCGDQARAFLAQA